MSIMPSLTASRSPATAVRRKQTWPRGIFARLERSAAVSLHIAHVNRKEDNDKKPFGSTFWHNSARSTWFVQASEQAGDEKLLRLRFFNRKNNLGPLHSPVGFVVEFRDDQTIFQRAEVTDTPDLAAKMSIRQRMRHLLKHGSLSRGHCRRNRCGRGNHQT